ncbi:isocitrate/isopropylmalate family dehydrogenase [Natranaerofaba carboxydovora]|uniref:isocitrate/isopropylmalate family dehydrogenase n=1 Tax=Natranaerofaba carboxydovora TaxID=2742683 RepID=UPI001F1326D6|nr:isocitrate/isopropylmalate family dehydrogenase [Natranaerofaba carboxydovora]UMZ72740.1 Isocitrate dehydrogenase [NADP] [Natranaerofaba carboxydovora]
MNEEAIQRAKEHFENLLIKELKRVEKMKENSDFTDYKNLDKIKIGIVGGDGIGPYISDNTKRVLNSLLRDEIYSGQIEFVEINGLTIENRAKQNKAVPDDILSQLKMCHVILKGPTTTPREGDKWPNIGSANVTIRRELDLFANMRPVKVPEKNIDWVFFRENTEDSYILGDDGINVTEELALDFKSITQEGADRIIRSAFEFARINKRRKVTAVTKANIIKCTDGKFLNTAKKIAGEYPDIEFDDWYVDIMAAKLIDPARQAEFDVIVLPNLYGDILTDQAAELQGGVGTAGSANIGKNHAMFEAIHGSGLRMVENGRGEYADPSSLLRASAMMLSHIGHQEKAETLDMALDICGQYEKKLQLTGRHTGATGKEYADYIISTMGKQNLKNIWLSYQS